jgi:hypothetical protein
MVGVFTMTDDKTRRDKRDRWTGSADKTCDLEYFAERNKISMDEARGLIRQLGEDRATAVRGNKDLQA